MIHFVTVVTVFSSPASFFQIQLYILRVLRIRKYRMPYVVPYRRTYVFFRRRWGTSLVERLHAR